MTVICENCFGTGIVNGKSIGNPCPDCMGTGLESSRKPPDPTEHPIGSQAKIELMRQRYLSNKDLYHPDDSQVFCQPDRDWTLNRR